MKGRDSLTGGSDVWAASPVVRWGGATLTRTSSPRRRLALAFAVSLLLHVVLLSSVRGTLGGAPLPQVLYVTLAATLQDAGPPVAVRPAPKPAPVPPQPAVRQPEVAEKPAAPKPAVVPPPPVRPTQPAPGTDSAAVDAGQSERAARPLGWPLIDPGLRKELVARKLRLRITVEADGTVGELQFNNAELSPSTLATLREAISSVRFAPGTREGREAASLLSTRLCFDDEGQFDQASPECWRVPDR